MSGNTLLGLLARAAASPSHGIRFLDRKERATFYPYADLLERARRSASWLKRSGVTPGDHVALILPTGVEFFDVFFGAMICGAIPTPLYPPIRLGRLDEYHERTSAMLRGCDARLVVTNRRIHRILGRTIERCPLKLGVRIIEDVRLTDYDAADLPRLNANSTAFIQFSSGTTAAPKPIQLSHRSILANVEVIDGQIFTAYPERELGFEHSCVSWLPLYHDMGLVGCVFVSMARPRTLTLMGPDVFLGRPGMWLRALSRYRGTVSPAPNFAYSLCARRVRDPELAGVDLSAWRVALNGAEPVSAPVLREFVERFSPYGFRKESLTPVYGMGEATLAVTFSCLRSSWRQQRFDRQRLAEERTASVSPDGELELVSVGPPLPGYAVQIREDDVVLPEGSLGECWIRGPSLMSGYRNMDRENARVWDGEWLNTGDCGFLYQGELYLFGRTKDTIVLRGKNFAAQDIEQALDGVAGVRQGCVAAVGVVGDTGEQLVVFVETHDGSDDARRRLVSEAEAAISARCALSAEVISLDRGTLPRTSSGKISRARARDQYLGRSLERPKAVSAVRMLGEVARSIRAHRRAQRKLRGAESPGE
ncbi:MAG: fatty acyl-AMP ligase [Myxococcota bacterium]